MGVVKVNRFDVFLVNLDPTVGAEIQKSRPCVVVSPDEMNRNIATVIIAPMTTFVRTNYPTRIPCTFEGKSGQIVLAQLRTVDKSQLSKRLGQISTSEKTNVLSALRELFAE